MPELRCTVQNCMHNQNYYCNLDAIQVGGDKAKNAADTCCDSFEERKSGRLQMRLWSFSAEYDRL